MPRLSKSKASVSTSSSLERAYRSNRFWKNEGKKEAILGDEQSRPGAHLDCHRGRNIILCKMLEKNATIYKPGSAVSPFFLSCVCVFRRYSVFVCLEDEWRKGKRGLFLFPQRWRGDDVPNGDQPPPTESGGMVKSHLDNSHAEVGSLAREGDG